MQALDKIYIQPDIEEDDFRVWLLSPFNDKSVCYISKDTLLEWLDERKKHYQGLIPAEGAVTFICAFEEMIKHIESL